MPKCRSAAVVALGLAAVIRSSPAVAETQPPTKPNIILFLSDDHTVTDCGPYGATDVKTPHLNRLAAESLKFTRAFAASPSCVPSRSSIYSGLFPMRHGAHANHSELKPEVKTLPHYLKPLGYETALIGKVHVMPKEQIPFDTLLESSRTPGPDRRDEVTLARTLEWLAQRTNQQPFCLVLATHDPHVPWELEERFGYQPQNVSLAARSLDTPETRAARTAYYSDITRMDERLGQLMDAMEQRGLRTNTVFIYAADQGAQWPFAKWGLYDAGIRVPLLVRWPGRIKPGTTTDALVSHVDLLATFVELAGGQPPADLDSRSFLPVLSGHTQQHRELTYAAHTADGHMNIAPMRCVRTDRYKYILNLMPEVEYTTHVDLQQRANYWASWERLALTNAPARDTIKAYHWRPKEELFDFQADPDETNNLAADPNLASVLRDLRGKMSAWRQEQHDADVGLPASELNQRLARNQAARKAIAGGRKSASSEPPPAAGAAIGSWGDQGDGTFRNPILNADYPDVDIERDGDRFYMISSTIHCSPGMTILESPDLVNWTIIGHVFDKLSWDDKYDWRRMAGYGAGVWAGDLAKHDGRWFCYFINGGLYVSTAEKITGPWSAPECVRKDGVGTDPAVFWDHEQKQGWLICKAGSDTSSPDPAMRLVKLFKLSWGGLKLEDDGRVIYRGRGSEAAKIYKINGQFYVFLVDNDARDGDRKQVVLRGPRLDGPLERKVVLERGNGVTRSCCQGALVQAPDGEWWLSHQLVQAPWRRQNGILWNECFEGRSQWLVPVTWQDSWPVVGADSDGNGIGNTVHRTRKPVAGFPITAPQTDDDFAVPKLALQWQWNHDPRDTHWSLTERSGWLRLKAGKPVQGGQRKGAFWNAANTLSQRLMGTGQGRATAKVDLSGMKPGQRAGLCHFGGQYVLLGVKMDEAGNRALFFNHDGQETIGPAVRRDRLFFRTEMNGRHATFSFSGNGKAWQRLGPEFELRMGHWRGDRIGFFCWNDKTDELAKSGHFDADWFRYTYDGPKLPASSGNK